MNPDAARTLSWLLDRVDDAERASLTQIFPLIYDDLRRVAQKYMSDERFGHTLQPTALVNEAFVRMRGRSAPVCGHSHALALASIAMRRILVDHARMRTADKRLGGVRPIALSGGESLQSRDLEILELDELIHRLAALDARRARVVELRFFAGMTNEEIADALGVVRSTVAEDWAVARVWLRSQLRGDAQ
ncbi:MAG: ECF-type sigma factor [Phycisphaerae bacterium]